MSYWLERDADGRILQAYIGGEDQRPLLGGILVPTEVLVDPSRSLWVDGAVVDLGPPPSVRHVMDVATRAWIVPGVSELELAQAAKWEQVKAERDRRESATFPYMGKQLQCDVVSVLRMTGAKEAALAAIENGVPFSETWTCADNSLLPVDAEAVLGMLPALAIYSSGLHATARALRAQIYAEDATDASVAAVAWPAE